MYLRLLQKKDVFIRLTKKRMEDIIDAQFAVARYEMRYVGILVLTLARNRGWIREVLWGHHNHGFVRKGLGD